MTPYLFKLFILLLPILTMISCAQSATPPPSAQPAPTATLMSPAEPVTITWAFWGDPWEVEINERVIELFEKDNPNIKIQTFHRPWNDYFKEVRAMFDNGQPVPDVLFWTQAPIDIPKGYFKDLSPEMEAENYDLSDFYPGLLVHFRVGDKIYGLPRDSDTKVIFYNKRAFIRADVPFPQAGWSWEELRATSLALKEAGVTDYSFAYEVNHWWMIWIWQNNLQLFDDKLFPTKTFLGEPGAAEAIQFFADLTNVDQTTPPYEVLRSSQDIAALFSEGKVAMVFGNHALVPAFTQIKDFEWDVVGLPQHQRRGNVAAGAGYVISANTPHPQEAWEFLKFLSGPKGQAIFAESGLAVPARRSVAESQIFKKAGTPYNVQIFLDEVEIGEPDPAFVGFNEIMDLMNEQVLPPVWRGEQDAAGALKAALPQIEQIVAASQPPEQ